MYLYFYNCNDQRISFYRNLSNYSISAYISVITIDMFKNVHFNVDN